MILYTPTSESPNSEGAGILIGRRRRRLLATRRQGHMIVHDEETRNQMKKEGYSGQHLASRRGGTTNFYNEEPVRQRHFLRKAKKVEERKMKALTPDNMRGVMKRVKHMSGGY